MMGKSAKFLRVFMLQATVVLCLSMVAVSSIIGFKVFNIWQSLPSAEEISLHYGVINNRRQWSRPDESGIPAYLHQVVLAAEDPDYLERGGEHWSCLRTLLPWLRLDTEKQPDDCQQSISSAASRMILTDLRGVAIEVDWPVGRILTTIKLEREFSRHNILDLYMNHARFGRHTIGLNEAAMAYYRISAVELTLSQAAMLAVLLAAPGIYDPLRNPGTAKEGRDRLIQKMVEHGMISSDDGRTAQWTLP